MQRWLPLSSPERFAAAIRDAVDHGVAARNALGVAHAIRESWDGAAPEEATNVVPGLSMALAAGPDAVRAVVLEALDRRSGAEVEALLAELVEEPPTWLEGQNTERPGETLGRALLRAALGDLARRRPDLEGELADLAARSGAHAEWAMHWVDRDPAGRGVDELRAWAAAGGFPGPFADTLALVYGGLAPERLGDVVALFAEAPEAAQRTFIAGMRRDLDVDRWRSLVAKIRPADAAMSPEAEALDARVRPLLAEITRETMAALRDALRAPRSGFLRAPWSAWRYTEATIPGITWVWERVADALGPLLLGDDPNLRRLAVAFALFAPAPSLGPRLLTLLRRGELLPEVIYALIEVESREAATPLRGLCKSPDEDIRGPAWLGLAILGDDEDRRRILPQLERDPSPEARAFCYIGLGHTDDPAARERLLRALRDPALAPIEWPGVRHGLWLQGAAVRDALLEIIAGVEPHLAARALEALAHDEHPETRALLLRELALDMDGPRGIAAAHALMLRGDPRGAALLHHHIEKSGPEPFVDAARRLATSGDPRGFEALLHIYFMLEHRQAVAEALEVVPPETRTHVIELLEEGSPAVKRAAIDLLGVWRVTSFTPTFTSWALESDDATATIAAVALIRFGAPEGAALLRERVARMGPSRARELAGLLWQPLPADALDAFGIARA